MEAKLALVDLKRGRDCVSAVANPTVGDPFIPIHSTLSGAGVVLRLRLGLDNPNK